MEYPDCLHAVAFSPSLDSHDRTHPDQDNPVPPVVNPRRLEEPTAMLHFSCDICGKDLDPEGSARYVVKMEAFAATDPAQLTDDDLDTDHVEEMAQLLNEIEDGETTAPEVLPTTKKLRFDLCPMCYRKFVNDPLGREAAARLNFSEN
jgi:hypothetical protein